MFGLTPKEDKFYELFKQSTEIVCKTVLRLDELMQQERISTEQGEEMHCLEHEADEVTILIVDTLNSTFITPLDREDIYTLAQRLDDIVDFVEGTVERMILYKAVRPSRGAQELTHTVVLAAEQVRKAFLGLNNIHFKKTEILAATEQIYELESEGDKLYRGEVARLFEYEKDPIEIIKWKEILEHIETALDHCESMADLLKGVVLKYD